jgi:anti-sigma factor RsiW
MAHRAKFEHDEQMSQWMSLALDGLLEAERRQQFERHLELCLECQARWKAMQAVSAWLEGAPMAGPSLGFEVRVERRLVERARKRRRWFGSVAVLTSSLSLAGITVAAVLMLVLGVWAWSQLSAEPEVQQGSHAILQVASGLSVMGKVASPLLKDLLLRYGLPLVLMVSTALVVLSAIWAWLYYKHARRSHRNGYA